MLDISLGGKTFKLFINSNDEESLSKFALEYVHEEDNDDEEEEKTEKDTIIHMENFTGRLHICKIKRSKPERGKIPFFDGDSQVFHEKESKETEVEEYTKEHKSESQLQTSETTQIVKNSKQKKRVSFSTTKMLFKSDNEEKEKLDSIQSKSDFNSCENSLENSNFEDEYATSSRRMQNPSFPRYLPHRHTNGIMNSVKFKDDFFGSSRSISPSPLSKYPVHIEIPKSPQNDNRQQRVQSIMSTFTNDEIAENNTHEEDQICQTPQLQHLTETSSSSASGYFTYIDSERGSHCGTLHDILREIAEKKPNIRSNPLNTLCYKTDAMIKDLHQLLESNPAYSFYQDYRWRLPLHIIAMNKELFDKKQKALQVFVNELLLAFPAAIIALDEDNRIPFTANIYEWIQNSHNKDYNAFDRVNSSYSLFVKDTIPIHVQMTRHVDWSFQMLSDFIRADYTSLNGFSKAPFSINEQFNTNERIIDNFSTIPFVLKTVLLIEDDSLRAHILDLPIIQQSLLNTNIVGDWIVAMLMSERMYTRAIDYFELISNLNINKVLNLQVEPRYTDKQRLNTMQEHMISHIAKLEGIARSIYSLPQSSLSRACSTIVVQRILDNLITSTCVLPKIMFDLVLNLLLLIGYDVLLEIFYTSNLQETIEELSFYGTPAPMMIWICAYFIIDEALFYLMVQNFFEFVKRYCNFWHLTETLAVLFVLTSVSYIAIKSEIPSGLPVAVTKVLLWLRVFGFLRNINMQLATFVLALVKIFSSLKWLMLALFFTLLTFIDLVSYLMHHNNICDDVDPTIDFSTIGDYCSSTLWRKIVRAYSIFAGDVGLDDYRISQGITVSWLLFTLLGIIILLNVLIAIVTEVYQKSDVERSRLFGEARVPLVARQMYMQKRVKLSQQKFLPKILFRSFFILAFLLLQVAFIGFIYTCLSANIIVRHSWAGKSLLFTLFVSSIFMTIANISLLLTACKLFGHPLHRLLSSSRRINNIQGKIGHFFRNTMYGILGIQKYCSFHGDLEKSKYKDLAAHIISNVNETVRTTENRVMLCLHDLEQRIETLKNLED